MRILSAISLVVMTFIWTLPGSAAEMWRETTFEDFRDGTFGDGGVNTYVSARGRIQNIYRWDANGDGYIDLLFANAHSEEVQVDMSIYWGNGNDFVHPRLGAGLGHAGRFGRRRSGRPGDGQHQERHVK
ncbi:MAG: hypothetical protein ACYST6_20550 [Planctomycetota bacterium]|jgi:hypothetical protein